MLTPQKCTGARPPNVRRSSVYEQPEAVTPSVETAERPGGGHGSSPSSVRTTYSVMPPRRGGAPRRFGADAGPHLEGVAVSGDLACGESVAVELGQTDDGDRLAPGALEGLSRSPDRNGIGRMPMPINLERRIRSKVTGPLRATRSWSPRCDRSVG